MSWTVAGAVDYKGFPANKSRSGGWEAAALILGNICICMLLFPGLLNFFHHHCSSSC